MYRALFSIPFLVLRVNGCKKQKKKRTKTETETPDTGANKGKGGIACTMIE